MRKHSHMCVAYEDRVMSLLGFVGNAGTVTIGQVARHWNVTVQRVHQVLEGAADTGFFTMRTVKLASGQWGHGIELSAAGEQALIDNYTECANADLLCINVAYIREREGRGNV